eukprot:Opistho-1_new@33584
MRWAKSSARQPLVPAPWLDTDTARHELPPTSSPRCAAGHNPQHRSNAMHTRLRMVAAVCILVGAFSPHRAQAQGIPVIDAANLIQTVQQVMNDITAINNQVQQIVQLQDQLRSISGIRNLGDVFNNPSLQNYPCTLR